MMTRTFPVAHQTGVLLMALLVLSAGLIAQKGGKVDDEPKRRDEPDAKIATKLDLFTDAVKNRKFERDAEAAGLVREIVAEQEKLLLHQKDVRDVVKAFFRAFGGRKRDKKNDTLYKEIAKAFGKFEEDGAAYAVRVYNQFDEEWTDLRKMLLEAVGETRSVRQYEWLIKEAVNSPHDYVKAHAGFALRHYKESSFQIRFEIVKRLIRDFNRVDGIVRSSLDPNDATVARYKQTLRAIKGNWNQTLSQLTGQKLRAAADWQKWWNKNKNSWRGS